MTINTKLKYAEPGSQAINPARLSADLGGNWHRSYGVAPCPVCQPQKRKDQNALTINAKDDRLLLHCKKSGCDFKEILIASGITPGTIEIDQIALSNAERERREQAAKSKARAQSLWEYANPINGTHGETYLRERGIMAAPDELEAYCLASFMAMPRGRQAAFLDDVQRRAAA